jgi:hypothetical protein
MTIHWKALAEHILMVPVVVRFFWGKMHFLNFSQKISGFKKLMEREREENKANIDILLKTSFISHCEHGEAARGFLFRAQ